MARSGPVFNVAEAGQIPQSQMQRIWFAGVCLRANLFAGEPSPCFGAN